MAFSAPLRLNPNSELLFFAKCLNRIERRGTLSGQETSEYGNCRQGKNCNGQCDWIVRLHSKDQSFCDAPGQQSEKCTERNAAQTREGLLQFETEQLRARLAEIDECLRNSRLLLDQARDRLGELSAHAAKLQSDGQYMSETCLNELGVQRAELMADTSLVMLSGEPLVAEDQGYREMRLRKRRTHVSRHIVDAFGSMLKQRVAIGHKTRKETLQIALYLGVGVFLD